jgi:oxalate decarboxylase/phosphoglucose isomerase-like protein (cupin superfamily)
MIENNHKNNKGYFQIARENSNISFADFQQRYYQSEQPVVIENIGALWPAKELWTEDYIREQLSREPTAKAASLWYWMEKGTLDKDYQTPEIINRFLDSPDVFPRTALMRIWIHKQGNVSSWHYDANMVNVFNIQVKGKKEFILVSPETPLDCYPFTSFAIMDDNDERIFQQKIYTKVTLNEGDMLYIPPLWFHKVFSLGEENINLNWIFTKKETTVSTKTLTRELERYSVQIYLSKHRYQWVRNAFQNANEKIPGYLRWKWRYPEMIRTPQLPRRLSLIRRTLDEMSVLGKVLWHAKKIQPYIDNLRSVKKLERKST